MLNIVDLNESRIKLVYGCVDSSVCTISTVTPEIYKILKNLTLYITNNLSDENMLGIQHYNTCKSFKNEFVTKTHFGFVFYDVLLLFKTFDLEQSNLCCDHLNLKRDYLLKLLDELAF